MITDLEILKKTEADEGLTVEEIKRYYELVKPTKHVYGKYGTLAKIYLEEHNIGKFWALGKDLPKYLHNVDDQANRLHDVLYEKLSKNEKYRRTGDYLEDVKRLTALNGVIEEEILNEIVYMK